MADTMKAAVPWQLWAVGALTLLWNGFGLLRLGDTALQGQTLQVAELVWSAGLGTGLVGAILLLLRRRLAVVFLTVSFIATLLSLALPVLSSRVADPSPWITAVLFAIYGLITAFPLLYARAKAREGVLR